MISSRRFNNPTLLFKLRFGAAVSRASSLPLLALSALFAVGCSSQDHKPLPKPNAVSGSSDAAATSAEAFSEASVSTDLPATTVDGGEAASSGVPSVQDAGGPPPAESTRCKPTAGTTGAPTSIKQTIDLLNGLPRPVTVECFVESLQRPLQIVGTYSVISAQPADGFDNPRLFLLMDGLVLSVVPNGDASELLDLGELRGTTRSIKAEIEFPIEETLSYTAPFERILSNRGGTICTTCHGAEEPAADYEFESAFESVAYQVSPSYEVNFDYIEYQYTVCDAALEPERCGFYDALFGQGQITRGQFPADMPVFF